MCFSKLLSDFYRSLIRHLLLPVHTGALLGSLFLETINPLTAFKAFSGEQHLPCLYTFYGFLISQLRTKPKSKHSFPGDSFSSHSAAHVLNSISCASDPLNSFPRPASGLVLFFWQTDLSLIWFPGSPLHPNIVRIKTLKTHCLFSPRVKM